MTYNVTKLADELRAVGLSGDCASDGRVDLGPGRSWRPGQPAIGAEEQAAASVLAAHDPSPTRDQRLSARGLTPLQAAMLVVLRKGTAAPAWAKTLVATEGDKLAAEEP